MIYKNPVERKFRYTREKFLSRNKNTKSKKEIGKICIRKKCQRFVLDTIDFKNPWIRISNHLENKVNLIKEYIKN